MNYEAFTAMQIMLLLVRQLIVKCSNNVKFVVAMYPCGTNQIFSYLKSSRAFKQYPIYSRALLAESLACETTQVAACFGVPTNSQPRVIASMLLCVKPVDKS